MRGVLRQCGMTAIEVLASTILSALLMTALIGVLRGLKAHERTLEARRPTPAWEASLEAALAADLAPASFYQLTPQALTLLGHGGRTETGTPNWLPSRVVYEVRRQGDRSALVRRELIAEGGGPSAPDNLALLGVAEIRMALASSTDQHDSPFLNENGIEPAYLPATSIDAPLPPVMTIELRSPSGETIFSYRHRRL